MGLPGPARLSICSASRCSLSLIESPSLAASLTLFPSHPQLYLEYHIRSHQHHLHHLFHPPQPSYQLFTSTNHTRTSSFSLFLSLIIIFIIVSANCTAYPTSREATKSRDLRRAHHCIHQKVTQSDFAWPFFHQVPASDLSISISPSILSTFTILRSCISNPIPFRIARRIFVVNFNAHS